MTLNIKYVKRNLYWLLVQVLLFDSKWNEIPNIWVSILNKIAKVPHKTRKLTDLWLCFYTKQVRWNPCSSYCLFFYTAQLLWEFADSEGAILCCKRLFLFERPWHSSIIFVSSSRDFLLKVVTEHRVRLITRYRVEISIFLGVAMVECNLVPGFLFYDELHERKWIRLFIRCHWHFLRCESRWRCKIY